MPWAWCLAFYLVFLEFGDCKANWCSLFNQRFLVRGRVQSQVLLVLLIVGLDKEQVVGRLLLFVQAAEDVNSLCLPVQWDGDLLLVDLGLWPLLLIWIGWLETDTAHVVKTLHSCFWGGGLRVNIVDDHLGGHYPHCSGISVLKWDQRFEDCGHGMVLSIPERHFFLVVFRLLHPDPLSKWDIEAGQII